MCKYVLRDGEEQRGALSPRKRRLIVPVARRFPTLSPDDEKFRESRPLLLEAGNRFIKKSSRLSASSGNG